MNEIDDDYRNYTLQSLKEAASILAGLYAGNSDSKFCNKLRAAYQLIVDAYEQMEDSTNE
jgi:hypothetical protein